MSTDRTIAKTVNGVPIYFEPSTGRFMATIGSLVVQRSRLREVEKLVTESQAQHEVIALSIDPHPPTEIHQWSGGFRSGYSRITITGHRDGYFRRGAKGQDRHHGSRLYTDSHELRAKLDEIARRCRDAVIAFGQEWDEALAEAEALTPEHLTEAAREGAR